MTNFSALPIAYVIEFNKTQQDRVIPSADWIGIYSAPHTYIKADYPELYEFLTYGSGSPLLADESDDTFTLDGSVFRGRIPGQTIRKELIAVIKAK